MVFKIIAVVIALASLILAVVLYQAGGFTPIQFSEKEMGPYTVVYEEHTGPYAGTAEIQNKIYYALLNDEKIETTRGFGIYYDNPKKVAESKLRSIAGCILEPKNLNLVKKLEAKYKIKVIPAHEAVTTTFPMTSKLSVLLGIFKVYPQLEMYSEANGIKSSEMMEIYDIPGKTIIYLTAAEKIKP